MRFAEVQQWGTAGRVSWFTVGAYSNTHWVPKFFFEMHVIWKALIRNLSCLKWNFIWALNQRIKKLIKICHVLNESPDARRHVTPASCRLRPTQVLEWLLILPCDPSPTDGLKWRYLLFGITIIWILEIIPLKWESMDNFLSFNASVKTRMCTLYVSSRTGLPASHLWVWASLGETFGCLNIRHMASCEVRHVSRGRSDTKKGKPKLFA